MTRRLFDDDVRRHFAGRIMAASGQMIRADGWVFVFLDRMSCGRTDLVLELQRIPT